MLSLCSSSFPLILSHLCSPSSRDFWFSFGLYLPACLLSSLPTRPKALGGQALLPQGRSEALSARGASPRLRGESLCDLSRDSPHTFQQLSSL